MFYLLKDLLIQMVLGEKDKTRTQYDENGNAILNKMVIKLENKNALPTLISKKFVSIGN